MLKQLSLITFATFALGGCVLDESNDNTSDADSQYSFALTMGDITKGVAQVSVQVTDNEGNALPDSQISVTPLMNMTSGMKHGAPVSAHSGTLNPVDSLTNTGEFTTTAYFLMPSVMGDEPMGDWSIHVEFEGESQKFDVTVNMSTADVKRLSGGELDQNPATDMNGDATMESRTYYLFERTRMAMENMNSFEVFIAAREDMMNYAAVSTDTLLNEGVVDAELAITSVSVEMCNANQDCTVEDNWVMAMAVEGETGVYKAMNLGLVGDDSDEVEVRLNVNQALKTSNGEQNGLNARFTFDATTDMPMVM
ncbi:MAG: hypothetical protein V7785_18915 [Bermanella sp.]